MQKIRIETGKFAQEFEVEEVVAKRVETLRIGDKVKVLLKPEYSEAKIYPGVIIGYEPFKNLPTVIVAYVDQTYNSAEVKFLYFNADTKKAEIVKAVGDEKLLEGERATFRDVIDNKIAKLEAEIADLEQKRDYFDAAFRQYLIVPESKREEAAPEVAAEGAVE